jgi:circadian clock protein KaiC
MYGSATPSSPAATGIGGLDQILGGGFSRDRIYLVQGNPGVGKTTLGLQFLLTGAAQGERGLYVTLSETREELEAVAASHGWNLDGLDLFELTPADALSPDEENTLFHPSDVELGETTKALLARIEHSRPARVVFDSLSELRLLAQSPLRYRRQILALKQFFIGRRCTVLLLDDLTSESADMQLQSLAHGVVTLEHLSPVYGAERRRLRVLKMRGTRFRGGFHDFRLDRGGMQVFARLVAADHKRTFVVEPISSGVQGLDELLGGGLDRGTSTLLMGPAGSGKSTIAVKFAVEAAKRGERSAIFAFDESRPTLFTRARSLGMDLEPFVQSGHITVRQVDPAEMSPGELTELIREAVEDKGVSLVVLDSLNGYLYAMPEEQFLILQLHELLTYLGQLGTVTILVEAQQGLIGPSMKSPIDISYLADGVVLLRHFEAKGHIRRAVSVLKKRSGSHETNIREMTLGPEGIKVGRPLSDFHGILTGVPQYQGRDDRLMATDDDEPQPG